MSQEKVDRYKKEKANRKKNMKKEKLQTVVRRCAYGIVGIVLIGWVGYSVHNTYESNKAVEEVEIDYTAVSNYTQNLMSTE